MNERMDGYLFYCFRQRCKVFKVERSIFLINIKELSAKCFELTQYQYDVMQINLLYSQGWLYSKIIRTRYNNEQRDVKEVKILLRQ